MWRTALDIWCSTFARDEWLLRRCGVGRRAVGGSMGPPAVVTEAFFLNASYRPSVSFV